MAADGGFECALTSRDLPASRLPVLTGTPSAWSAVRRCSRCVMPASARRRRTRRAAASRVRVRAGRMDGAGVRVATFHVESTVVERLAPGDVLHLRLHRRRRRRALGAAGRPAGHGDRAAGGAAPRRGRAVRWPHGPARRDRRGVPPPRSHLRGRRAHPRHLPVAARSARRRRGRARRPSQAYRRRRSRSCWPMAPLAPSASRRASARSAGWAPARAWASRSRPSCSRRTTLSRWRIAATAILPTMSACRVSSATCVLVLTAACYVAPGRAGAGAEAARVRALDRRHHLGQGRVVHEPGGIQVGRAARRRTRGRRARDQGRGRGARRADRERQQHRHHRGALAHAGQSHQPALRERPARRRAWSSPTARTPSRRRPTSSISP